MQPWHIVWDIESTGLLNSSTIDYTSIPYKLKPSFGIHCIVVSVMMNGKEYIYDFHDGEKYIFDGRAYSLAVEGIEYKLEAGYEPVDYIHKPLTDFPKFVKAIPENSVVAAHNQINFDLLAVKLFYGVSYEVERNMAVDCDLGRLS